MWAIIREHINIVARQPRDVIMTLATTWRRNDVIAHSNHVTSLPVILSADWLIVGAASTYIHYWYYDKGVNIIELGDNVNIVEQTTPN